MCAGRAEYARCAIEPVSVVAWQPPLILTTMFCGLRAGGSAAQPVGFFCDDAALRPSLRKYL